jgi:hypothetical protein
MSELDYIGADELVFNNDIKGGIHSGGFNVKSIMMKAGMSPIITLNTEQNGGGEKVSDLFNDLVIPNWTLSYNNRITGGKNKEVQPKTVNDDSDDEDDVVPPYLIVLLMVDGRTMIFLSEGSKSSVQSFRHLSICCLFLSVTLLSFPAFFKMEWIKALFSSVFTASIF